MSSVATGGHSGLGRSERVRVRSAETIDQIDRGHQLRRELRLPATAMTDVSRSVNSNSSACGPFVIASWIASHLPSRRVGQRRGTEHLDQCLDLRAQRPCSALEPLRSSGE